MRIYAGMPAFVLMLMLQLSAGSAESVAADNRRLFCGSRMMGDFRAERTATTGGEKVNEGRGMPGNDFQ